MLKRLMSLATLLVLCGVMALSVPAMADRNSPTTKATATNDNVTVVKTSSFIPAAKAVSVRPGLQSALRYWLRSVLGLPPIPIEVKPPDNGEPLKSGTDQNKHSGFKYDFAPMRDNGGHGGDQ